MTCNEWIDEFVKDKTFADVGGLWGVVNEKITVAAQAGAVKTTMIDMQPLGNELWKKFHDRCATEGVSCSNSIEANVDDSDFPQKVGNYDVVHCSGVIYHCPNPLYTVSQLTKITNYILILASTVIEPKIKNAKGEISVGTGGGLFVPALNNYQKEIISHFYKEVGASGIIGIDEALQNPWSLENYAPWWWLLTTELIASFLEVCGFNVREICREWDGRTAYFMAVKK